jgi:DNA-directed RNA polymerase sigma subunit (sigma70/sigma32)
MKLTPLELCQFVDSTVDRSYATFVSEAPLLAELKRAGKRLARARADVDELIIEAAKEGHSLRILSKASGVSHERVRQLLQRRSSDG